MLTYHVKLFAAFCLHCYDPALSLDRTSAYAGFVLSALYLDLVATFITFNDVGDVHMVMVTIGTSSYLVNYPFFTCESC